MQLEIKNFQSIKNQTVQLKGFTVFEGKSDCGKSALRRAIDSLLFNSWDNAYLREGTRTCTLSLNYDDVSITQTKGSENSYDIEIAGKRKHFDKVGKDTPDLLKNLGYSFFETTQEYYNVHVTTQLEPLYMITYKPTENTRILNSLFDIDIFGEATNMSASDMTILNRAIKLKEAELDQMTAKLFAANSSLTDKTKDLANVTNLYDWLSVLEQYTQAEDSLSELKAKAKKVKTRISAVEYYLSILPVLLDHSNVTSSLAELKKKYNKVDLKTELMRVGSRLQQVSEFEVDRFAIDTKIKKLNAKKGENEFKTSLLTIYDKLSLLRAYYVTSVKEARYREALNLNKDKVELLQIYNKLNQIKQYEVLLLNKAKLDKSLRNVNLRLEEVNSELSKITVCPTCGTHLEGGIKCS